MQAVMKQEDSRYRDSVQGCEPSDPALEWEMSQDIIAHPQRDKINSESNLTLIQSGWVSLALDELQCFEGVHGQFQYLGVTFANAIALQPSNPAYGVEPGVVVLMGAPKSGVLDVTFQQPVRQVGAIVTSSRPAVLSAYDGEGKKVAEVGMPSSQTLDLQTSTLPRVLLRVSAESISKVSFSTFDGQLILNHFRFKA